MKQIHLFPEPGPMPLSVTLPSQLSAEPSQKTEDHDLTPQSSASSTTGSFGEKSSLDASATSDTDSTGCNYYDIPLPADSTPLEQNICKYLQAHGVHVSSPDVKSQNLFTPTKSPKTVSSLQLNRKKSLLLERRRSLYVEKPSGSFKLSPDFMNAPQ